MINIITPEEYIERLREIQKSISGVNDDLEKAINMMSSYIETGDDNLSKKSRLTLLSGWCNIKAIGNNITKTGTALIED